MHIERMHKMQECLTEKAVSEFERALKMLTLPKWARSLI